MTWQFLAVAQTIPTAAQLLMLRHVARGRKKFGAATVNLVTQVELWLCGLIAAPFLSHFSASIPGKYWGIMTLEACFWALSMMLSYRALEHLTASVVSILQTMCALFTIILGYFILHETFQYIQIIGAALLIPTIWATLWLASREDKHLEKSANWRKGVSCILASSTCSAGALISEKYVLSHLPMSTYVVFGWGTQCFVALCLALALDRTAGYHKLKQSGAAYRWVLGSGLMRGTAALVFIGAQVLSNNVALVSVIGNFKIILIAVFGALVLKEHKLIIHKLATASMAVCGLALMLRKSNIRYNEKCRRVSKELKAQRCPPAGSSYFPRRVW